jgi:hypothetical protein
MEAWTVETLNAAVDAELEALPADMRARFVRIAGMIEALGLEKVGAPTSTTSKGRFGKFA